MIGIVVTVAAAAIDIELIVIAVDLVTIAKAAVIVDVNIVVVRYPCTSTQRTALWRLIWVLCAVVVQFIITVTIENIDAITVSKVVIAYAITDGTISNVVILVRTVFGNDDNWTQTPKIVIVVMCVTMVIW